ncbi:MAG TPA: extracellular solute-binding protein, partial [Limnochordia bacterium]|nr:extracellular solute-binding protein [Limnochordia bacterium]
MKRWSRGAFTLAVAGGAVFGGVGAAALQADPVTLVWADRFEWPSIGGPVNWEQTLIDQFEQKYPNIKVVHELTDETKWVAQIAAGGGPDLLSGCCTVFHDGGVSGAFLDLTPFLGTTLPDYVKDGTFWPPQMNAFNSNGKQFALPQYLGTIAEYANVEDFNAAGVAIPSADLNANTQNWDGFEAMVKKLTQFDASGKVTRYGIQKGVFGDRSTLYMRAAGAEYYVDGDHSQSALASPEAVAALAFEQRLMRDDQALTPIETDWGGSFGNNRAAVLEDGSWNLGSYIGVDANGKAKVPFQVSVFPVPIGPSGERPTLTNTDGFAIPKTTKHVKEALLLLEFMVSHETTVFRAKYLGMQPPRKDVVPEYLDLMESFNHQSYEVNAHVFTDESANAYPQYFYTKQTLADTLLTGAEHKIFDDGAPVQ